MQYKSNNSLAIATGMTRPLVDPDPREEEEREDLEPPDRAEWLNSVSHRIRPRSAKHHEVYTSKKHQAQSRS